jgi:hypothetical protein
MRLPGYAPPEDTPYRAPDSIDIFANYKNRDQCDISALDLHVPVAPLCSDRQSLLWAMSSGGRAGYNLPYLPRGCDMRWFTTEEICEILSRFEKVVILGDSLLRQMTIALYVLLRQDLGYGGLAEWNIVEGQKEIKKKYDPSPKIS